MVSNKIIVNIAFKGKDGKEYACPRSLKKGGGGRKAETGDWAAPERVTRSCHAWGSFGNLKF